MSIIEFKERYAAADRRVNEMSVELKELPSKIEAAAREEARAKARTAREGGNVATAVALPRYPPEQMRRFFYLRYGKAGLLPHQAALCPERRIAQTSKIQRTTGARTLVRRPSSASCTPMCFIAAWQRSSSCGGPITTPGYKEPLSVTLPPGLHGLAVATRDKGVKDKAEDVPGCAGGGLYARADDARTGGKVVPRPTLTPVMRVS